MDVRSNTRARNRMHELGLDGRRLGLIEGMKTASRVMGNGYGLASYEHSTFHNITATPPPAFTRTRRYCPCSVIFGPCPQVGIDIGVRVHQHKSSCRSSAQLIRRWFMLFKCHLHGCGQVPIQVLQRNNPNEIQQSYCCMHLMGVEFQGCQSVSNIT